MPTVPPSEPGDPGEDATVDELIAAAEAEFQAAEDALRAGGPGALSLYEGHIARARDFVDRANSLLARDHHDLRGAGRERFAALTRDCSGLWGLLLSP